MGLVCRGPAIEPEFVAPPLTWRNRRLIGEPVDGQVILDRSYDRLKEVLGPNES